MKYLYIGVSLLAVTLAASILTLCALNTRADETAAQLEAAIVAFDQDDWQTATACVEKAESLWNHHKGFLGTLLDHEESDTIQWGLANIRSFAVTGSGEEFRAGCTETAAMIRHVAQMERPYYYNIL